MTLIAVLAAWLLLNLAFVAVAVRVGNRRERALSALPVSARRAPHS